MELKQLCEMQGISGREELVRMAIYNECAEVLGAENVKLDRMGNVIAHKAGYDKNAPHVMLSAHMDEVGLMVINATDDGLLRVRAIGGIDPRVQVSKRVKVGYAIPAKDDQPAKEPLNGVIGAMAIHQQTAADRKNVLPIEQLFVDIGAKDKDEALSKAPEGTPITFATAYTPFGDGMLLTKAADDRVGCYTMLRLLHANVKGDTDFVFTCQEEVGCRGATGAAFRLQPDVAIALEGTTANDAGDMPDAQKVCQCGKGVAISFMDNASIANPELFREMLALAEKTGVSHQVKMSVSGGNEGGAMQRSGSGARTVVLSVPCRYIHSPSTVCSLSDIEAQYQLAKAYLEN
ncbi:MAG: M20/M25/M40 family metallo-hydrolase [Clostridia bacterium]|nr:M20/M25/M40 family metallo-hydrolase [Clostridia bacterium]